MTTPETATAEPKKDKAADAAFNQLTLDQQAASYDLVLGLKDMFPEIFEGLEGLFEGLGFDFGDIFPGLDFDSIENSKASINLVKNELDELVQTSKGLQDTGSLNNAEFMTVVGKFAEGVRIEDVEGFKAKVQEHFKDMDLSKLDLTTLEKELSEIPEFLDAKGNAYKPPASMEHTSDVDNSIRVEVTRENIGDFHFKNNGEIEPLISKGGEYEKQDVDPVNVNDLFDKWGTDKLYLRANYEEGSTTIANMSISPDKRIGDGYYDDKAYVFESHGEHGDMDFDKIPEDISKRFGQPGQGISLEAKGPTMGQTGVIKVDNQPGITVGQN